MQYYALFQISVGKESKTAKTDSELEFVVFTVKYIYGH